MNIVLLGAPGAGKGTQAALMQEKFGLKHLSTGDMFRENIKGGTPVGLLAKSYIDAGKLVPDEVTCEIVKQKLEANGSNSGYIFDGFPRNINQACKLEEFATVDVCINLSVDNSLLMERICGRRVCSCGASYHISTLGGKTTCAKCGKELYQRADDNPETVGARLETYKIQTAPLIDFYKNRGKLVNIDCGTSSPDEVFSMISVGLEKFGK